MWFNGWDLHLVAASRLSDGKQVFFVMGGHWNLKSHPPFCMLDLQIIHISILWYFFTKNIWRGSFVSSHAVQHLANRLGTRLYCPLEIYLHVEWLYLWCPQPKGADRKLKTDREKIEKKALQDREKYQPSHDTTLLKEVRQQVTLHNLLKGHPGTLASVVVGGKFLCYKEVSFTVTPHSSLAC